MKDEVIIFMHIHKTGGTSLRHSILEAIDPEKLLLCYTKMLSHKRVLFNEECEAAKKSDDWDDYYRLIDRRLAEDDKLKLVYGHLVPPKITSRYARYFAMMRHPYTHVISLYHMRLRAQPDIEFKDWVKQENTLWLNYKTEYEQYEKILFYEEYLEGLAVMSDVLGCELKEQRRNVHPKTIERSADTDRLIDEYRPEMLRLYDSFWGKRDNV